MTSSQQTQLQNGEEHNCINVDVEALLSPTFILIDPSVIEAVVCSREPPDGGGTDTTVLTVGHGTHVSCHPPQHLPYSIHKDTLQLPG
jgi:hypothetical protein